MIAVNIEGWESGVKIQHDHWKKKDYVYYDICDNQWCYVNEHAATTEQFTPLEALFQDCWHIYKKPKPKEQWYKHVFWDGCGVGQATEYWVEVKAVTKIKWKDWKGSMVAYRPILVDKPCEQPWSDE